MPGLMPHPRKLAEMGRGGDTEVGHLTEGEVVVPPELAGKSDVRQQLLEAFSRAGIDIGRYTVGGEDDSRNPRTGMREFYGPDAGHENDPGTNDGFGDGGDHHDAGAVSSADAADPGGGDGGGFSGADRTGTVDSPGFGTVDTATGLGGEAVTASPYGSQAPGAPNKGSGTALMAGHPAEGYTAVETNPFAIAISKMLGMTTVGKIAGALSGYDFNNPTRTTHARQGLVSDREGGEGAVSPYLPTAAGATGATGATGTADAAGARQYGYHTPSPDPNVPSWQRYLDV